MLLPKMLRVPNSKALNRYWYSVFCLLHHHLLIFLQIKCCLNVCKHVWSEGCAQIILQTLRNHPILCLCPLGKVTEVQTRQVELQRDQILGPQHAHHGPRAACGSLCTHWLSLFSGMTPDNFMLGVLLNHCRSLCNIHLQKGENWEVVLHQRAIIACQHLHLFI